MFSRDNKEMSKKTRSPLSGTGSSPTPTLDLTRKPIVLRYNTVFFETSSMVSLNDDESSSPPPVDQLSRTSFFSDSRINLSGSRNSLTRVSEHTLNTKDSWASESNSNPSFPIASDIPFSPSPMSCTASSEVIPLLSQQFQMNPLSSISKQKIVEEEEKIVTRTKSSIGSTDGLSVKNNSYTKGKSVRTRSRKFFSCEEPSTIFNSSATTDNYYDSNSMSNSPMVLRNVGKRSDETPVGYPRSVPKDQSSLSTYRDSDTLREFMKQKGKRYFCNLLPGIRQRKVDVKLDDQKKEAKSTEGKRYFHDFISRIWKRKDKKLDDRKEAIFAELYNILRKKEELIDARLSKKIDLAKKVVRETEEKIESEKLKAEAKMQQKIASAEKKSDDLKAKERQLRDKKDIQGRG